MTDITISIDVTDFRPDNPPGYAVAKIERVIPDVTGDEIITTAPIEVRMTDGIGTVTLVAGVVYAWQLFNIAGVSNPWYATAVTDMSAAELYRAHQVDPATLIPVAPIPSVGEQLAALQADVAALQTGGGGGGGLSVTPTGDGYLELAGSGVTETGDGYLALT